MDKLCNQPIDAARVCRDTEGCSGVAHRIYYSGSWQNASFPKASHPVICILIVSQFISWSATAQLSDWNIMTLMMAIILLPPLCQIPFFPHCSLSSSHSLSALTVSFRLLTSLLYAYLALLFSITVQAQWTRWHETMWLTYRKVIKSMRHKAEELQLILLNSLRLLLLEKCATSASKADEESIISDRATYFNSIHEVYYF